MRCGPVGPTYDPMEYILQAYPFTVTPEEEKQSPLPPHYFFFLK